MVSLFDVDFMALFNRDLNRGCLVYMFPLRFSVRRFRVRKIFSRRELHIHVFVFKITISKMFNYVLGCSFIKTCLLTGC